MEEVCENGNANRQQQHDDSAFSCAASPAAGGGAADEQQHMQSFRNDVPVFLDQTFRMIENVPDHIVSWSRAGDSFIIKQVLVFEEILPSYYNHNKFLSFVRQLNFYGFKKVKRRASSSPTFVTCPGGQGAGAMGAAAAATESDSWEEFSHPQFRRGRRDLLAGIKRQKDKGRSKRKQAETHKSDMLSDLATKLDDMSDELRAVNGKLDDTISLLSVHRSNLFLEHQNDGIYGGSGGGGGGGVVASFGGGNAGPYGFRAPIVDYASPRLAIDQQHHPQHHQRHQQEQEWHGNQLYSQQYQQASGREQDPATPNEVQHHMVQPPQPLPPLAAVAARASGPSADGALRHRLPPPYLPPRNSEINLQLVSWDKRDYIKILPGSSSSRRPVVRRDVACSAGPLPVWDAQSVWWSRNTCCLLTSSTPRRSLRRLCLEASLMEHIEKDVGNNNSLHHHADVGISPSATTAAAAAAAAAAQTQFFRKDVPHFLDQTFRMIENAPDQVVCWSQAGDSFIIRQVVSFEALLPYYYNHNKFMSFVRQLNFYGFKKVKAGAAAGAAAAAPAGELDSWQEFSHPQFQRGRRDLLAGIKRQKDKGRSKRKQDEVHKSSMLSDLSKKLDVMSDELRAVNGKLDDTMSLLLVQQNQNLFESQNEGRGGGGGSGGGGGRGSGTGSSVTSFDDDGLPAKFHGAPHIYMPPRPPFDQRGHQQHQHQQEQGWPGHHFYPQPYQQPPPTDQYPATPYEVSQERRPLPPLAAAVAARASEASRGGSAGHHLPPLLLPPYAPAIYKPSDGHESSSTLHPPT